MLPKARSTPVDSPAPEVIPATITRPVSNGSPVATDPDIAPARPSAAKAQATPSSLPEPASMTFRINEDNGGAYHWTIVADGGEILVRSAAFGSYEEAEQAAGIVHRSASRASFEHRSAAPPPDDLPARRDPVTGRDRLDAERWLDEGGSFSSEAVTR